MASYKEIVTKTVIGKAKKTSKNEVLIKTEQTPSTVLGCWVINHTFKGNNDVGRVKVNGSYDINVWYSYDSNHKTAVINKTFNYEEIMNVPIKNTDVITDSSEIIVKSLKQPNVIDVKTVDGDIKLIIEKELGVEVVGEAKIRVNIEDDEDDYEEIIDDGEVDNIISQIEPEYLN